MLDSCQWVKMSDQENSLSRFLGPKLSFSSQIVIRILLMCIFKVHIYRTLSLLLLVIISATAIHTKSCAHKKKKKWPLLLWTNVK